jgi:hypothetical protein
MRFATAGCVVALGVLGACGSNSGTKSVAPSVSPAVVESLGPIVTPDVTATPRARPTARATAAPRSLVEVISSTGGPTNITTNGRLAPSTVCNGQATGYFDEGAPQTQRRSGITPRDDGTVSWSWDDPVRTPAVTVWVLDCTAPDRSRSDGVWRGQARLGSPPTPKPPTPSEPAG